MRSIWFIPALVAGFLMGCSPLAKPPAEPGAASPPPEVAAPICRSGFAFEAWSADVMASNEGVKMQELDAGERGVFMRNFNAIPPVTDLDPARVLIFFRPGMASVVVAFVDANGCVFAAKQVPVPALGQLIKPSGYAA